MAVWLVGFFRQIIPLVELFIGVATFAADAIANVPFAFGHCTGGTEVTVKVLFAGQIGAPKGLSCSTVVHGALHPASLWVGIGLNQWMTGQRTRQNHFRLMGDPAIIGAVFDHLIAVVTPRDFHDSDALEVLQQHHLLGRLRHALRGCRQVDLRVHIFRVHSNDLAAIDFKELHTVRVFAKDLVGHLCRHTGFGRIGPFGLGPKRIPPTHQNL